ncbi:MAG TPA: rhomboid family intramembrane serine protease [Terriglobia bacterium]|nr:rhomboid family intramembrane serine protease [Terriglobia bacterium]
MPRYTQSYMSFFPPFTRMVKGLIIVTAAVFVVTYLPLRLFGWQTPFIYLGLQPFAVAHRLYLWQLVTYLFLHGGFFHILFNMFALWMFGPDLEQMWGESEFLKFYLICGIGAGVFDVVLNSLFGSPNSLTIGASGAIYGLLLAFGLIFPNRPIFIWFVIPIPAKWFVVIIGAIEFFSEISGPGSGIAHLAHLGGMLVAYLYLRGGGLSGRMQLRYEDWRRARLRRKFEVYMRDNERKDDPDRWIN